MLSVPRHVFLYACNLAIIDLSSVTCPCDLKNPINRRRAGIIFDAPARRHSNAKPASDMLLLEKGAIQKQKYVSNRNLCVVP